MILTENLQNPLKTPNIESKVKLNIISVVWTDCQQSLVCEKKNR
jgi:hypothetical protein